MTRCRAKALIDAGIEKDVKAEYAGGHPEALLALVNGKVDAAEINSQTLASATAEGRSTSPTSARSGSPSRSRTTRSRRART